MIVQGNRLPARDQWRLHAPLPIFLSMPKPKPESPDQHERFKGLARELGCDEDEVAFDQALKKVAESGPALKHEPKKRSSDISKPRRRVGGG
jgi:hypothetical protein